MHITPTLAGREGEGGSGQSLMEMSTKMIFLKRYENNVSGVGRTTIRERGRGR